MLMPIEHIPDWEQRLARQDAFWHCDIIDRPVVNMHLSRPNPAYPWPAGKEYAIARDAWMDCEAIAQRMVAGTMNTEYLGDALPAANPNLGPEVFSAFCGCEMDYTQDTSWTIPNVHDWSEVSKVKFTTENYYWKKMNELTDALLTIGKGIYYVGITDLHPGADAIAAFRDPLQMNIDMIESPEEIRSLLDYVTQAYFTVYDHFYNKLRAAGQACTAWPGIVSSKKWYVPSNDFSCMISKAMFDEFFLPGIAAECRHMEANIYHLDGPGALQHLDSLLAIPELNAIQWVYGAGNGRPSDWLPVYQKCQAAGKGLQIGLELDELDLFMDTLKPNGLWLTISGVPNREVADAILKKMLTWK